MSLKKIFVALTVAFTAIATMTVATAEEAKLKSITMDLPGCSGCRQKMVLQDQNADGIYDYVKNWCYDNTGMCYRHYEGKLVKFDVSPTPDSAANVILMNSYLKDSVVEPLITLNISKMLLGTYFNHIEIGFYGQGDTEREIFKLIGYENGQWSLVQNKNDSGAAVVNSATTLVGNIVKHFTPGDSAAVYSVADLTQSYDEGQIIGGNTFDITLGKYVAKITTKYEIYDKNMTLATSIETASKPNISIDIKELAGGTYYLKQYFINGETATSKIVKY